MNEYLDFIKFALDEISKIDDINSIEISEKYVTIYEFEFKVSFKKLGLKYFYIPFKLIVKDNFMLSYKYVDMNTMKDDLISKIDDFKKEYDLKELNKVIDFYENELKKLKERLRKING